MKSSKIKTVYTIYAPNGDTSATRGGKRRMGNNKVIIVPVKSKASQEAHTSHIYTRNHRSKKRQPDMAKMRTWERHNDILSTYNSARNRHVCRCTSASTSRKELKVTHEVRLGMPHREVGFEYSTWKRSQRVIKNAGQ